MNETAVSKKTDLMRDMSAFDYAILARRRALERILGKTGTPNYTDPKKPKRGPNDYFLFIMNMNRLSKDELGMKLGVDVNSLTQKQLFKIYGNTWKSLPESEKEVPDF